MSRDAQEVSRDVQEVLRGGHQEMCKRCSEVSRSVQEKYSRRFPYTWNQRFSENFKIS